MPYVHGRALWGAKQTPNPPARDNWGRANGVTLVIHHTAGNAPTTKLGAYEETRSIQRQHLAKGWNDIGYNYIIGRNGIVMEGRGWGVVGAHTLAHNTGTIGVSLQGNLDVNKPTLRQRAALTWLALKLRRQGARIVAVRGHKDMPKQATACPGRYGTPLVAMVKTALRIR